MKDHGGRAGTRRPAGRGAVMLAVLLAAGCGSAGSEGGSPPSPGAGSFDPRSPSTAPMARGARSAARGTRDSTRSASQPEQPVRPPQPPARPRSLADLLPADDAAPEPALPEIPLPEINDSEVAALGIRKIAGTHLVLYTDLSANADIDELPLVFDRAVPQWCEYFRVSAERARRWRVVGYLMQDKDRFLRGRLLPADLPEFLNGYQRGVELWWYEQPSPYYRRHLLLHEGTHAFMRWSLGGAGPPWYMEGTAELLATHRWQGGHLTLRYFPASRLEVPEWGRVKIIRDEYRANRALTLLEILRYDTRAHLRNEPYGWCWGLSAFLDGHPAFQQRFRELRRTARDAEPSFSERFLGRFEEDAQRLWREWQWFVMNLDYGYNVPAEAFQYRPVVELPPGGATVTIAANRGWQSAGVRLTAGRKVRLAATGRYLLRTQPQAWPSEPNGVTIHYHLGQPLGMVLAALVDESNPEATDNGFLNPLPVGLERELAPELSGTLFLRINDSPAGVADNQGTVEVDIRGF